MTEDVARRSIDWLHDNGCRVLALMGGEVLLRPQFVQRLGKGILGLLPPAAGSASRQCRLPRQVPERAPKRRTSWQGMGDSLAVDLQNQQFRLRVNNNLACLPAAVDPLTSPHGKMNAILDYQTWGSTRR